MRVDELADCRLQRANASVRRRAAIADELISTRAPFSDRVRAIVPSDSLEAWYDVRAG